MGSADLLPVRVVLLGLPWIILQSREVVPNSPSLDYLNPGSSAAVSLNDQNNCSTPTFP